MRHAISAALVCVAIYGCAVFGPNERAELADTANKIEQCQERGREAGAYGAYDACMIEAGLHDAGAK